MLFAAWFNLLVLALKCNFLFLLGKQAVVVMSCENEHMPEDLILEPGLVMIFAHGVEWGKSITIFLLYFITSSISISAPLTVTLFHVCAKTLILVPPHNLSEFFSNFNSFSQLFISFLNCHILMKNVLEANISSK